MTTAPEDDLKAYEADDDDPNEERAEAHKESQEPHGIIGVVEDVIDTLTRPLADKDERPNRAERARLREEADQEARADQTDTFDRS